MATRMDLALVEEVLRQAQDKALRLRLAGSYAVYCLSAEEDLMPDRGTPFLLVAPSQQIQEVRKHLTDGGFRPLEPPTDRFAFTRHCFMEPATRTELRVAFDLLETDVASIPLSDRLELAGMTLPPSEILLTRLGWSLQVDRYFRESEALLRKFEIAGHDDGSVINGFSFALRAHSSVSLEGVVKRNLRALAANCGASSTIGDRIGMLEIWLESVRRSKGATVDTREGSSTKATYPSRSGGTRHPHSLYRNWIYPTPWM